MHILVGVIGIFGILFVVLWRIFQGPQVSKAVGAMAGQAPRSQRRWHGGRVSHADHLREIEDPREAAVVMMVAIAQYEGPVTEAQVVTMRGQAMAVFGLTSSQADAMIERVLYVMRHAGDIGTTFMKVAPVIDRTVGPKERRQLVAMLRAVHARSGASPVPEEQILRVQRRLD